MNWKQIVDKKNADTFVLPAGWDSREKVAHQLECSIDRVSELLAPGIKDRSIETKSFPVWDNVTKRKMRVTAYRFSPVAAGKK